MSTTCLTPAEIAAPQFARYQVNSMAALREIVMLPAAFLSTTARMATLGGYYAAGDGGGNHYTWDAASVLADDDCEVIKPNNVSGAGRWIAITKPIVNLKQCGAAGDGVTDDTSVIQALLDSKYLIYAPAGTYLNSGLTLNRNGLMLFGDGVQSVFKMTSAAAPALTIGSTVAGVENTQLRDFRIFGRAENLGGIKMGEHARYIAWFRALNVQIDNFSKTGAYCVQLNNTQEVEFQGCVLKDSYDIIQRPDLGSCTSTLFSGSSGYIGRAAHRGVELLGVCADITFNNQIMESTEYEALYSVEDSNVILNDCYFEDTCGSSGQATIYLTGPSAFLEGVTPKISRCHFHIGRDITKPNLKMDYVLGGYVNGNVTLFGGNGGVVTTANTECHFSDNYATLAEARALVGPKISVDDYDLTTSSRYSLGDKRVIDGHIYSVQGTDATALIHANAGTGATVSLSPGSNDTRGTILFQAGSGGWAAGKQFSVDFNKVRKNGINYTVLLFPVDSANSPIAMVTNRIYVSNHLDSGGFDVYVGVAFAAATNYYFSYLVIG